MSSNNQRPTTFNQGNSQGNNPRGLGTITVTRGINNGSTSTYGSSAGSNNSNKSK